MHCAVPKRPLKEYALLQVWALGATALEMAAQNAWVDRALIHHDWDTVSTALYQHKQGTHCGNDWGQGHCHLLPHLSGLHASMLGNDVASSRRKAALPRVKPRSDR